MTSITLSIDKNTLNLAIKRANINKIHLSTLMTVLLQDYTQGKISVDNPVSWIEIEHIEGVEIDTETQKIMEDIGALWNQKRLEQE